MLKGLVPASAFTVRETAVGPGDAPVDGHALPLPTGVARGGGGRYVPTHLRHPRFEQPSALPRARIVQGVHEIMSANTASGACDVRGVQARIFLFY
jgi:hypothetical protein